MMKLAYPKCCGADIHKNSIVATIVTTDKNGISEYLRETVCPGMWEPLMRLYSRNVLSKLYTSRIDLSC